MEEPAAEYLEADVFLNGEAHELTEAAAKAFAARVPAHAPATRQFTTASKDKLLKRLQADPELVTAEGYKQFGYSGPDKLKGDERLIEREYWLKFNRAVGPDLAGAHGWVLVHMHFAGSLRSRDDSEITQINVRHTWDAESGVPWSAKEERPGDHYKCRDFDRWGESFGKQIWAFRPPWRWKVESERRDCPWVPTLHKLLQKFQRCTKVVRKKVVDAAPSTVAAGGAADHTSTMEEYTEPDWSALERPHEAPWPFTILFVGVDNGDKLQPDLKLKEEFKKIEQAYRESMAYHADTRRVVIKQLLFSQWSEVMVEICKEMPTALHVGCHAHEGGGLELFQQTVKPSQILPEIISWNRDARRRTPPRPEIRLIVLNACESDTHALDLTEGVDFAIGHRDPVNDGNAIEFSRLLYDRLFDSTTLLDSFNIARSCCKGYRLLANKDPSQFCLVPLSAQPATPHASVTSPAAGSAMPTTEAITPDSDSTELVRFLKDEKLSAIAVRFSEAMGGMEAVEDLKRLRAEDLDDPDLSFLKRWQKEKLLELAQRITAGSASLRDNSLDASDLSGADTSEGEDSESGDDADSFVDAAIAKHPGNPENFQEHMRGFIKDLLTYMSEAAPETATQTFHVPLDGRSHEWSYCMLVWMRFAKDAIDLEESLRVTWFECIKVARQDRLLAMLDSCLRQESTRHKSWSRADFESLGCSKPFAAAIFVTDMMVRQSLKRHAESVLMWQQEVVKNWFKNEEDASVLLLRANRFLREHAVNGISVETQVVETQSYVAFMRMTPLASLLLFEYLEARKADNAACPGAAGDRSALFYGFRMFVSSSRRVFSLTDADVPARHAEKTVLRGLRCLSQLSAQAWELLGPMKMASEYVEEEAQAVQEGADIYLKAKDFDPDDENDGAGGPAAGSRENERKLKLLKDDVSRNLIQGYLTELAKSVGVYVDSASGEERRVDGESIPLVLFAGKSFDAALSEHDAATQKSLTCPITSQIMQDPVKCSDGKTYERAAIENWYQKNRTSPLTRETLESDNADSTKPKCTSDREIIAKIQGFKREKADEEERRKRDAEGEEENEIMRNRYGVQSRERTAKGQRKQDGKVSEEKPFNSAAEFLRCILDTQTATQCACLTGPPASGKTVTMFQIVHAAVDQCRTMMEGGDLVVPVFIRASELSKLLSETRATNEVQSLLSVTDGKGASLRHLLVLFLEHCVQQRRYTPGVVQVIAELFDLNHLLICIDGLDEAAAHRELIENSIDQAARFQKSLRLLLSTREHSYVHSRACFRLGEIEVVKLQPLTSERQMVLIKGRMAQEQASTFKEQLDVRARQNPELATSPFLLSLMIEVYKKKGGLPAQRVELYKEQVEGIVSRHIARRVNQPGGLLTFGKSGSNDTALDLAIEFLEVCAFVCQMRREERDFKLATCSRDMQKLWSHDVALLAETRALLFDDGLVGLISRVDDETYRFSHLTLQEYLAARCTVRLYRHDVTELVKQLEPLHSRWRREVLQFTACMLDEDTVFTEFCQAVLQREDGSGANCELVRAFVNERGDSEQVEQMLTRKLLQLRGADNLVVGLCHPSPDVRELLLSEMRQFQMPPDPYADGELVSTLKKIAEDTSAVWYQRRAGILSLAQIANMEYYNKRAGAGRANTLKWMLQLLNADAAVREDIGFAVVKGLGSMLSAGSQRAGGSPFLLLDDADEPVLLETLSQMDKVAVAEAIADLQIVSDGLVDWLLGESRSHLITEGQWPLRHVCLICDRVTGSFAVSKQHHAYAHDPAAPASGDRQLQRASKIATLLFRRLHSSSFKVDEHAQLRDALGKVLPLFGNDWNAVSASISLDSLFETGTSEQQVRVAETLTDLVDLSDGVVDWLLEDSRSRLITNGVLPIRHASALCDRVAASAGDYIRAKGEHADDSTGSSGRLDAHGMEKCQCTCKACGYKTEVAGTRCKFGPKCNRKNCKFAHASPSASHSAQRKLAPAYAALACSLGFNCQSPVCNLAHPSPALKCLSPPKEGHEPGCPAVSSQETMLQRASKLAFALFTRLLSDSCKAAEREETICIFARLRGLGIDLPVLEMLGTGDVDRRLRVLEVCAEANILFAKEACDKLAQCLLEENVRTAPASVSNKKGKESLCKFFQRGNCKFGKKCRDAHGKDQLQSKLCKEWMQGSCKLGSKCKYTHGKSESLLTRALQDGKATGISYNFPKYLHEMLQAKAGSSERVDRALALLAQCQPGRPAAEAETAESTRREIPAPYEEPEMVRTSSDFGASLAKTLHAHDVAQDCDPVPREGSESRQSDGVVAAKTVPETHEEGLEYGDNAADVHAALAAYNMDAWGQEKDRARSIIQADVNVHGSQHLGTGEDAAQRDRVDYSALAGSRQSRQKHAQDRDDSTKCERLDELEDHLVEVSKSPALRDPGCGGPAALICAKLWRASQLIKDSSLPTAAAADEATMAYPLVCCLVDRGDLGDEARDSRQFAQQVAELMQYKMLGRMLFSSVLHHIRAQFHRNPVAAADTLQPLADLLQSESGAGASAEEQVERQLLLKELRIGRRAIELAVWSGAVSVPQGGDKGGLFRVPMRLRLEGNKEVVANVSVVHADLSEHTTLLEVPEGVRRFRVHLRALRVKSEALQALPEWLGKLGQLQMLVLLQCTGLTALPASMGRLAGLQKLDLYKCSGLTALPEWMGRLMGLQELALSECSGLTALPESMGRLTGLQKLDLSFCSGLTALPESMGRLTGLQKLALVRCSGLTALPESMGSLTGLGELYLSSCSGLTALPESMGSLTGLGELDLSSCSGLTGLPESMGSLTGLQKLDLSGCSGLTALPESMGSLTGLQELVLFWCSGLTALPESMGSLTGLQNLDLRGCPGLTGLPESMGSLTGLQKLDLSGCSRLTALPESMGSLTGLQELVLYRCSGLTALPESMGRLTGLQTRRVCKPVSPRRGLIKQSYLNKVEREKRKREKEREEK